MKHWHLRLGMIDIKIMAVAVWMHTGMDGEAMGNWDGERVCGM